jgi:DNA-binding transcriptional regulator YiaG
MRRGKLVIPETRCLNTSPSTAEKRASGPKKPSGMALKLLNIVE